MTEEFFNIKTSEEYEEVFEKYLKLTVEDAHEVRQRLTIRAFLCIDDINLIQKGLVHVITTPIQGPHIRKAYQLGYMLEDIKRELMRRESSRQEITPDN